MMLYPEGPDDLRAKFPGLEWKYTREQVTQFTSFEAKAAGTLAEENMEKMGISCVTFDAKQIEHRPVPPGPHYELIVAATWEKVRQNQDVEEDTAHDGRLGAQSRTTIRSRTRRRLGDITKS
jgi:hypothetical protein